MARKTAEQERADYFRFKLAYSFLLIPLTSSGRQTNFTVIAKTENEARQTVSKLYPSHVVNLVITSKFTL